MTKLLFSLVALFSFSAFASPAKVTEIDGSGLQTLDIFARLAAKDDGDFAKFLEAGDEITGATLQPLAPQHTKYTFTIRHVDTRTGTKLYLGGAHLTVFKKLDKLETELVGIKSK